MADFATKTIDLSDVRTQGGAKVFAGRLRGASCRDRFGLAELDSRNVRVRIRVPEDTLAVTTSFLLSFLGPSMVKAGSAEAFKEKFTIDCPSYIQPSIDEGIRRALHEPGADALSVALGS